MRYLMELAISGRKIQCCVTLLFCFLLGNPINVSTGHFLFGVEQGAEKPQAPAEAEYALEVGDVIELKLYYNPELNERVTIRPDGKVSFQLVNEIRAAGMTPSQLSKVLVEKFSRLLRQPEVVIIVREFAGQKVYIGGEVFSPRIVPLIDKMTALQAIVNAGGQKETAYLKETVIISKDPQGTPVARKVNLAGVVRGQTPQADVLLKPFDIVYVPKSRIAKINKFIEQYVRNLLPGTLTAGFSYAIYSTNQAGTIQVIPTPSP
jgi:polysaccharide export outer membrane protein